MYAKAVGAGKAIAGILARLVHRFPAGMKVLRAVPFPAKRLIVHRLSITGMPSLERARVGQVLYDLDLRDLLQRSIYFNAYEKRDLRTALRLAPAGGVCMDIGSCVGYYALNLARRVGPAGAVHAFEPDSENHERLVRNCHLNGLDGRVRANRIALSDLAGEAVLRKQHGRSGDGTLAGFAEGWTGEEMVRTVTVDEYVRSNGIERIDFAKIDVEGHELNVLAGASATLKTQTIRNLLVEFNGGRQAEEGHSLEEFLRELSRYGYRPAGRSRVLVQLLRRRMIDPKLVSVNLLFRPSDAERSGARSGRGSLLTLASRVKQLLLAPVPPKLYWHLMGRFRPVAAVTSGCDSLEDSLESGGKVVELLDAAGVLTPEATVLQIGSGIGRVEKHLASRVSRCYGVDISPAMVTRARELVPHSNVEFCTTDGVDLAGWHHRNLDLVFSIYVFQHLPREQVQRYLREAFRCLRPGGKLLFQVMIDEKALEKEPPSSHPYALRYYRRRDLTSALEAAGYSGIRTMELSGGRDLGNSSGDLVFVARKP